MTVPTAATRWAGIAAGVLLLAGATAALVLDDGGGGDEQVATDAGTSSTSSVDETTTTTSTTLAPSSSTSITASILKVTSTTATTAKPTTTTTKAPTFSISPTSGPSNTQVTARGAGCKDPAAGVGITLYTPSGKAYNGTGGSTMPDGTWELPFTVPADEGPGRYKIVAACNGRGAFTYAPQYFTVTG